MVTYFPIKDYSANLVANYKFNETTGTTCTDSTGNYNGTYTGTTSTTDSDGTFRRFNGTSDFITFSNQVVSIGKKSIKFKIKTTTTSSSFIINNSGGASANYGFCIQINNTVGDGKVSFYLSKGTSGLYNLSLTSNKMVCDGNWHTVLFTWDGTINTNSTKLYIDDLINEDVVGTPLATESTKGSYNLFIGKTGNPSSPYYFFNGSLDEIEIYNDVVQYTLYKCLIQDKNSVLYTYNGVDIVALADNTLSEANFINNGFNNPTIITESVWTSNFPNLTDATILTWTNDTSKTDVKLVYDCNTFDVTQWLRENKCKLLMWTDDMTKTRAGMFYNMRNSGRPLDKFNSPLDIRLRKY